MKKIICLIAAFGAAIICSSIASAQQIDECLLQMSYYQDYYKQGTKDAKMAALNPWRKAYSVCKPGTRQNLYIHGADLYRMLISQNSKNPEYRAALVDTLVTLHKLRAQYYPNYADKAFAALSKDVNNYLKNDPEKTYEILKDVIDVQGEKSDPVTFVASMNAAVKLYKAGKLDAEAVINLYDESASCFTELQKADTTQNTRNLRTTFENAFINSRIASCENLIEMFGPRFEENKDDYDMVKKIATLMAKSEDCTKNDLFFNAVTTMHSLRPNANSAYFLYRLNVSKDPAKAMDYLSEAVSSEELDNTTKAQYTYELALLCLKNGYYVKAVDAAGQTMALDSSFNGKCYSLIGHAWMSVSCGGDDEIARRAKFWVASDYFSRAIAADSSLAEDVAEALGKCRYYYPTVQDAFMYNITDGESYSVACGGLRAITTVRTTK